MDRLFRLDGRVAVITGGAGMLGRKHAEAILEMGGRPVLLDVNPAKCRAAAEELAKSHGTAPEGHAVDITDRAAVAEAVERIVRAHGRIDILINNAAMTVESSSPISGYFAPFEDYDVALWEQALRVSLTGAFLCAQAVGKQMLRQRSGVILNIASDVGVISPDHRIYRPDGDYPGTPFNTPVSYAVAKAGLISFTRYLATYWAPHIRVNALSPAGVYNNHDEQFVKRLTNLIPMGRMATKDEYKGAVIFLVSDASAFMTGFNVVMDGGRTCW
ncbi:MAG: SDR family oxidoreductase [Candidatus Omnitrophica bacterium]|nr:SDR family oxidoreductase [Candidatus Omnitrophota bacterium]